MRTKAFNTLSVGLALVLLGTSTAFAQAPGGRGGGGGFKLPPLLMQSTAFEDGGIVPQKYAGRGGVQPDFKFSNAPDGTVAYAIILHDVDVALGGGTDDVDALIAWNIPASANGIPEGKLPEGSVTWARTSRAANTYMESGAPPESALSSLYLRAVCARNASLIFLRSANRAGLHRPAMKGKTVAKAAYVGRYRSPAPASPPAAN